MKNGWRITPKLHGDPEYARYIHRMAEEQKKLFPAKPKPIKPEGMSDEDFIFSLQPKSTQQAILNHKDPDYVRDWDKPIENWEANADIKAEDYATHEEYMAAKTGERKLTTSEILLEEDRRRKPRNQLGQSDKSGTSKADKERAAHHFVVSPPATLSQDEIDSLTNLTKGPEGVPASLPQYEWREIPAWKALWFKVTGKKVRSEKK